MNCRLNPTREVGVPARWVGGLGAKYETFRRWSQIGRPADVFVLIDENPASINDAYFAVDMSNTGEPDGTGTSVPYFIIDYPASHHSKGATVSFADGHVEVKKWTERTTLGPVQPRSHTSPTDRDVRWLQEHSTYLK
jgi:prepilin-type processing-associated H-X9-DG protein